MIELFFSHKKQLHSEASVKLLLGSLRAENKHEHQLDVSPKKSSAETYHVHFLRVNPRSKAPSLGMYLSGSQPFSAHQKHLWCIPMVHSFSLAAT